MAAACDDHAALPDQCPVEFARVTREHLSERRRLQELGQQIPSYDGAGARADEALRLCEEIRHQLALAREEAKARGAEYALSYRLRTEERQILERLGLTANLYREHTDGSC